MQKMAKVLARCMRMADINSPTKSRRDLCTPDFFFIASVRRHGSAPASSTRPRALNDVQTERKRARGGSGAHEQRVDGRTDGRRKEEEERRAHGRPAGLTRSS